MNNNKDDYDDDDDGTPYDSKVNEKPKSLGKFGGFFSCCWRNWKCRPFSRCRFFIFSGNVRTRHNNLIQNVVLRDGVHGIPLFDFFYQLSYLFLPANCLNKQTFAITCTASTSTTNESKNCNNNGGRTIDTTGRRVQCGAAREPSIALTCLATTLLFLRLRNDFYFSVAKSMRDRKQYARDQHNENIVSEAANTRMIILISD